MSIIKDCYWILFFILHEFPNSEQSTCNSNVQFLGLVTFSVNKPIGSVIYYYTQFANSMDIVSVNNNFQNNFKFNINTKQLIALVVFNNQSPKLYTLSFTMTCTTGSMSFSQNIAIVDNTNYQAQWQYISPDNYYQASINDNTSINTPVIFNNNRNPYFVDQDTVSSYIIYLIDPLQKNNFYISSIPGSSTIQISNNITLDYDILNKYNLTLFLMDMDSSTKYIRFNVSALVIINIIDTDSKPPIFDNANYQFQIYNNAKINSTFNVTPMSIRAYDGDKHINATINYKLVNNYSFLYLDPVSGILFLASQTSIQTFDTNIMAYQYNNYNRQTVINVRILISDSNNLISFKFLQKMVNITMPETMFGQILQINMSYSPVKSIQLTIQPAITNIQISSSGLVIVVQRFYYSINSFYNLTVTGTDLSTSDTMSLLIYILDINEIQPMFSSNIYYFHGILTVPNNTFNIQVATYDLNSYLDFQIVDKYGIFNISNSTNNLLLWVGNTSLLQATIYYLTIIVTESGQPPLSNSVNVSVDFKTPGPSSSSQGNLLALYILLPIVIILILILPIILCHYRKRHIFKASNASFTPSPFGEQQNIYIKRCHKRPKLNENVSNISDVYYSDSHVRQLPKNTTGSDKYRKKMKDPIQLEIKELTFSHINPSNNKQSDHNSEKVSVL